MVTFRRKDAYSKAEKQQEASAVHRRLMRITTDLRGLEHYHPDAVGIAIIFDRDLIPTVVPSPKLIGYWRQRSINN